MISSVTIITGKNANGILFNNVSFFYLTRRYEQRENMGFVTVNVLHQKP